ncbi:MAG: hypothetical protein ABSG03_27480 [Bryobacteraceae bacterium]|jgi:transketolase
MRVGIATDSRSGPRGGTQSGGALNVIAQNIPWFPRGSADLGQSNRTLLTYDGAGDFETDTAAGIRDHAMPSIVNGLSLSKLRALDATYFIFSDYARPARLTSR